MPSIEPVLLPRTPPIFASRRARRLGLLILAILILVFAVSLSAVERFLPMLLDAHTLRAELSNYGLFAPVAFILLQAAQVILAPVPGQILAFVGGYLFGPLLGTLYSLIGATLGSTIAFFLSRRLGRPVVEDLLHPETLAAVDGFVEEHGRVGVFLVFLLPGLPDDALCLVAGLTTIPLGQLVVLSIVGRLPAYLLITLAGARIATQDHFEAGLILGGLALVTLVVYWKHEAILDRLA